MNIFKMYSNKIYKIDKSGKKKRVFKIKGLNIIFNGKNSTIIIHEPIAIFKNCNFYCGNNCQIEVGSSSYKINKLDIYANANNVKCKIGKSFSCTGKNEFLLHKEPNLSITIGDNCMFGTNIILRTSDAHTIYEPESKKILNYGKSITIGDNCWLAMDVTILKGVTIAKGCVIGTKSTVTKSCKTENSLYIGTPAVLKKTNISWDRKSPVDFK